MTTRMNSHNDRQPGKQHRPLACCAGTVCEILAIMYITCDLSLDTFEDVSSLYCVDDSDDELQACSQSTRVAARPGGARFASQPHHRQHKRPDCPTLLRNHANCTNLNRPAVPRRTNPLTIHAPSSVIRPQPSQPEPDTIRTSVSIHT